MTDTTMHIHMNATHGGLTRLMGLVSRRGFEVGAVTVNRSACGTLFEILLSMTGNRPVACLTRQIENMYDVRHVRVEDDTDEQARVA